MKNKISKKLLDLNFNASCKGFFLLVEAIEMKLENRMLNLGELCHLLAKSNQMSPAAVDKNLRTCINKSNNEYKDRNVIEVINILTINISQE